MKHVYTRLLTDDELRPLLERGDSIVFKGIAKAWQDLESQLERLGFGAEYAVSRTRKPGAAGEEDVTRVSPIHTG